MPRRKKLPKEPDYIGIAPNQQVQKSNPLQALSDVLSLPELKILDAYLSRINSHEPDKRFVRFEKGELEKLLGVTQLKKSDLDDRLKRLFASVRIQDEEKPKGYVRIGLFEKAMAEQDEDGLWQVDLICTESAMEYIFNIENLHYLQYRLRNVVNLTSLYSYRMFVYLEKNRFRKSWEVSVKELKDILSANAESYNQYKRFNDLVLKKCYKELNEKTECHYEYRTIKRGRSISSIKFIMQTNSDLIGDDDIEGQMNLDDYIPDTVTPKDDYISFISAACIDQQGMCEFTQEEMEEIATVLVTIPENRLPDAPAGAPDDIKFRQYHYLRQKYAALNTAASRNEIKHRHAYLMTMIKKDSKDQ